MRKCFWLVALLLCFPGVSQAHFLWLLTDTSGNSGRLRVFFGEAAEPDDPELLTRIAKARVWTIGSRGDAQEVPLKIGDESLEGMLPERSRQNPAVLNHTYGVFTRGDSSFLLNYYAKTYPFALPGTWHAVDDSEKLPLEIVPVLDGKSTVLTLNWQGKPSAGSQIVVVGPGLEGEFEGTTDEAGVFRCDLPEAGVYSIRARLIEDKAGKHGDEEYSAVRHYSTLSLRHTPLQLGPAEHGLPELPKGITSFGGAVASNTLYVYGGNYGSAHSYYQEGQSNDLWALNLKGTTKWKKLGTGPKLQGLAMVEHKGKLYRVGGFTAMNKEGEDQDLQSQASSAMFDPATGEWTDLPPMPEPRSSHDAAVMGDRLYVAGGWNMRGKDNGHVWHDSAFVLDLSADKPEWKPIALAPFKRRALSLAAWNEKLYCIGGMRERGGPSTRVDIYDPATDSWSQGASLLGTSMDGFGSSSFACGGALFTSTISGSVQRLSADGRTWKLAGQLESPRFFHRLVPWRDNTLIAVGGGNMSVGKVTEVDVLRVKQ